MSSVNLERTRTGQRSRSGSSFLQWSPITLSLAVFALALFCSPLASQSLQFDRAAVAGGELWRVFTGHFTHWNLEHLFWDVSVFAVLGVLCERRNHGRYLLCLPAAAAVISLGVWLVLPNIETYRGLSGINSALFTLLADRVLAERWLAKDLGWVTILASLIVGFGLKLAFELQSGASVFVESTAVNYQTVPLAHVSGALTGFILALSPTSELTK